MDFIASKMGAICPARYLRPNVTTALGSFVAGIDKPTATRIVDIVDASAAGRVGLRR
jgi:hypothetical protein